MSWRFLAILLLAAQLFPQSAPSDAEFTALVAALRTGAAVYTDRLPDFLCTQTTRRTETTLRPGRREEWKLRDTLAIRVSFSDRKEKYELIGINGKPATKTFTQVGGWTTQGDFGGILRTIFVPKSEARFAWARWEPWEGRNFAVLSWSIEQAHSEFASTSRRFLHIASAKWAARGEIFADPATHEIFRITIDSVDMPKESPISEVHLVVEYAYQEIAGQRYLLPSRSVTLSSFGKEKAKSDSTFTDYRKFAAASEITYK